MSRAARWGASLLAVWSWAVACGGNDTQSGTRCGAGTRRVDDLCVLALGASGEGGAPVAGGANARGADGGMPASSGGDGLAGGESTAGRGEGGGGTASTGNASGEGGVAGTPAGEGGDDAGGVGGAPSACSPSWDTCGDGLDQNCDGYIDEGCSCELVAPGEGGSLRIVGGVTKLLADPARCLSYALTATTPADLLVIDTGRKQLLHRVALPGSARDLDISPDGKVMAIAGESTVWRIDPTTWQPTEVVTLPLSLRAIEVTRSGAAYVASNGGIYSLMLQGAAQPTVEIVSAVSDLELSADEERLFGLSSNISGWMRAGAGWSPLGSTSEYTSSQTGLYLSPSGLDVFDGFQRYVANDLKQLVAVYGRVLAQAQDGSFDVGPRQLFDARTRRPLAPVAPEADAALILNADRELWFYRVASGRISYANRADYFEAASLGLRSRAAKALGAYAIRSLLADPTRDRLYGLDAVHQLVLSIDAETGTPLEEVDVEPGPTDFAIDDAADALLVSHDRSPMVARIDLDAWELESLLRTPILSSALEPLSQGRFALAGAYGFHRVPVIDARSGALLEDLPVFWNEVELAAADGGRALFVATNTSLRSVDLLDVSTSPAKIVTTGSIQAGDAWALAVPNGSGLLLSTGFYSSANLNQAAFVIPQRLYTTTPDGSLATSAESVFRLTDGTRVGALPRSSPIQAMSTDGSSLFVLTGNQIVKVPLASFQ